MMVADSEALKVVCEILSKLPGIGEEFQIRLNHRKLLDGMMQLCGVPDAKLRPICSAIDKLDKETWETVKDEMVSTKGLDPAVADRLGELVKIKGEPRAVMAKLRTVPGFAEHPQAGEGLRQLEVLFRYLSAMNCLSKINFDLSLARGLDYYTGVIYEAAQTGESRVGSIAAGGRYDGLVGMFSGREVPAVGVSIGIERILTIMEDHAKGKIRRNITQVYVGSVNRKLPATASEEEKNAEAARIASSDALLLLRLQLSASLWEAGIPTEYSFLLNPGYNAQLKAVSGQAIPHTVWIYEDDLDSGVAGVAAPAAGAGAEAASSSSGAVPSVLKTVRMRKDGKDEKMSVPEAIQLLQKNIAAQQAQQQ